MTNLTNKTPASTYGDLLTFTNNGAGVTGALQTMQDGLGQNSALQLSNTAANVNGNLTVSGTISSTAVLPAKLLSLAADPAGVPGMIYYRNAAPGPDIRAFVGAAWVTL